MTDREHAEQFKDYPEGSGGKRLYDQENLPLQSYLTKYYAHYDRNYAWNRWHETANMVLDESKHGEYKIKWGDRGTHFDFQAAMLFYAIHRADTRFEDDIIRFLAYLEGDGFFKAMKINFAAWLTMPNFANPLKPAHSFKGLCLLDFLQHEFGQDFIRDQLTSIAWLRD
jgi:hypothetical protein